MTKPPNAEFEDPTDASWPQPTLGDRATLMQKMQRVFEVILTTHTSVLMEAESAAEARECMRVRCCREIGQAEEHEITAVEVTVKPEDRGRVLVA